jgi:hypothetical protein
MGMACSTHGKDEKFNILIGKCEGKRPLWRPRRKWEDKNSIKSMKFPD